MRRSAWERWQAAAGPWKGWSVCPALLAPDGNDVVPTPTRQPEAPRVVKNLAPSLEQGGVMLILDLDPILGVIIAARLNQHKLAHAVLVLPRWPYQRAILPTDALVEALVSQARRLSCRHPSTNVAFVLDAQRSCTVPNRSAHDQRADNRYRLAVADLPDLAALRRRGIRRVVKLSSA